MRIMPSVLLVFSVSLLHTPLWAQSTWRCPGNYYTNNDSEAKKIGECVVVNTPISVLPVPEQVPSPQVDNPPPKGNQGSGSEDRLKERNNTQTQQKIKQTQQELQALQQEYNGGEPVKIGPEHRNHQKYLDRVEQLKRDIQSKENEIKELEKQVEE